MSPYSIRWTNFFGDYDDYHEVNIIGPYPDRDARNRDLWRLERLPGNNGDATFETSDSDDSGADNRVTPDVIAKVATFREFVDAFFNLSRFNDDEIQDEVHPDQASIYTVLAEQTGGRR